MVTFAVDSDETAVRALAAKEATGVTWAIATPELARGFGDVGAFPTLHLFGADGTTAATWYGAPPTLHADAVTMVDRLLR